MFFDRYKLLCDQRGISCNTLASQIGLSNATPTKWKKTGAIPEGATLLKIADYFEVPVGFLVDQQPFTEWEQIDGNRREFLWWLLECTALDEELMSLIWGVDIRDPQGAPAINLIALVGDTCQRITRQPGGAWEIVPRTGYKKGATQRGYLYPELSKAALALAQDFDRLDEHGQDLLQNIIAFEMEYRSHISDRRTWTPENKK